MKKINQYLLLGLILTVCACKKENEPEFNCKQLYYYDKGQKIDLEIYPGKLFVQFKNADGYGEKNAAISKFSFLQQVNENDEIQCGACSAPRLSKPSGCKQIFESIAALEKSPEVKYVSPIVITPDGKVKKILDSFGVKLKTTTTENELKALIKEHGIIGQQGFFENNQHPLFGYFFVDKTSKGNALETANSLYETGKFEECIPLMYDVSR